jgi:hypothetical protein
MYINQCDSSVDAADICSAALTVHAKKKRRSNNHILNVKFILLFHGGK